MPPTTLKVLVVGPKESGKTTLSNFISGQRDTLDDRLEYRPTVAARVLEFDRDLKGKSARVDVELWDVSGDHSYEQCWPAILKDVNGILIVFNPDNPIHAEEVGLWYEWFGKNSNLDAKQCLVFAHRTEGGASSRSKPPKALSGLSIIDTSWDTGDLMRTEFDGWMATLSDVAQRSKK